MSPEPTNRELQIGMVGTFDVDNYGDLLFPLIAHAELSRRLSSIQLHCFSYHQRTTPDWPFEVLSLSEFPSRVDDLDGLLIGGGHILRFDKSVAPDYFPPLPEIHHPTGYWLAPALMAVNRGLPVTWNAPGVNGELREWAEPLMRIAIAGSAYVSARDENSRTALRNFANGKQVHLAPDSAFGVGGLLNEDSFAQYQRLCDRIGLLKPYIILQANDELRPLVQFIRKYPHYFKTYQIVLAATGPVHGDDDEVFYAGLKTALRLPDQPNPLVMAELIRHADAVFAVSLHVSISAVAFGVPLFRPPGTLRGKHAILTKFAGVHTLSQDESANLELLKKIPSRIDASQAVSGAVSELKDHWDRISAAFASARKPSPMNTEVISFWQRVPALLEARSREEVVRKLTDAQREIDALRNSTSWRLTSPLRTFIDFWRREKSDDRPFAN